MKKLLLTLPILLAAGLSFGQKPSQIIWEGVGAEYSINEAEHEGISLEATEDVNDELATRGFQASGANSLPPISLVCSFTKEDLMDDNTDGEVVEFEVKWYYYLTNRRMLMKTEKKQLDPSQVEADKVVKLKIVNNQSRQGFWEVQILNKKTKRPVEFAGQTIFKLHVK